MNIKYLIKKYVPENLRNKFRSLQGFFFNHVFDIFPFLNKSFGFKLSQEFSAKIIQLSEYQSIFCGYYDFSPFNPLDSNLVLLNCARFPPNTNPVNNIFLDIILYDTDKKSHLCLGKTDCWNWQQGARAHWLDQKTVCFNVRIGGRVSLKIINIDTKKASILDVSMNMTSQNRYIYEIDYRLLNNCSEYGYSNLIKSDIEICEYDLIKKSRKKIISKKDIENIFLNNLEKYHLNHILPNANSRYIAAIARGYDGNKRFDALVIYDNIKSKMIVPIKNQIVSHYCWMNETTLLAWCEIDSIGGYYIFEITSHGEITCTNRPILDISDGHPVKSISKSFISDLYEIDFFRRTSISLFEYDLDRNTFSQIIKYRHDTYSDPRYRCDMHPSISSDHRFIQIDIWEKSIGRSVMIIEKNKDRAFG